MESTGPATMRAKDDVTTTAAQTSTMRAVVQDLYGSAEVLRVAQVDVPKIEANEVLVRVHAAGIDRGTLHLLTGKPYLMRIMGFGFRKPKNQVPGLDVAGTVVAVGEGVTRFAVGEDVFGVSRGAFAEYAVALEEKLAHKPGNLTFEQAAVVPISGLTALRGLCDPGRIEAGQQVLVIGASGGVGTYAVQLAKAFGAQVTGVCSTAKMDLVRSLGADHVVDYTREDFAEAGHHYDLILDIGGNASIPHLRRALAPRGTLAIVGGEEGGNVTGGFGRSLRAAAMSPFVRQRLTMLTNKEHYAGLEELTELIEAGQVTPSIDSTVPLDGVPEAISRLESGSVRGKIAVSA